MPSLPTVRLPLKLASLRTWSEWDHALAYAAVTPHLLSPDNDRHRGRIRTVYYLHLLRRMKRVKGPRAAIIKAYLESQCDAQHLRSLTKTSSYVTYQRRLHLTNKGGAQIRSVLTTGLVAKVLVSPHAVHQGRRTLTQAYNYVYAQHRTGLAVESHNPRTRVLWFSSKRAAHLCAAFVDFLQHRGRQPVVDASTLLALEQTMGAFLATALVYQDLLSGGTQLDTQLPASTRTQMKLRSIPSLACSYDAYYLDALPRWDARTEQL
jgi:hypothetical protein